MQEYIFSPDFSKNSIIGFFSKSIFFNLKNSAWGLKTALSNNLQQITFGLDILIQKNWLNVISSQKVVVKFKKTKISFLPQNWLDNKPKNSTGNKNDTTFTEGQFQTNGRNSSETPFAWKEKLTYDQVTQIQENVFFLSCSSMYRDKSYKL